jgi:hypothetical protein
MDASHTEVELDEAWRPKENPFELLLGTGVRIPVPYNEVHRLERLRAYNLTEMSFDDEYAAVVQTAMRVFDLEVRELPCTSAPNLLTAT